MALNITPTEEQEQQAVVEYLELLSARHKVAYSAIPNSTYTTSWRQKAKNKATGLRAGLPDLFIIINNTPLFIEMKRQKGGVLSPEQKRWIQSIRDAGIQCHVCKGAREAINIINEIL